MHTQIFKQKLYITIKQVGTLKAQLCVTCSGFGD